MYNFPPLFAKTLHLPYFGKCIISPYLYVFFASPSLTMLHLCIVQYTYWTPVLCTLRYALLQSTASGRESSRLQFGRGIIIYKSHRSFIIGVDKYRLSDNMESFFSRLHERRESLKRDELSRRHQWREDERRVRDASCDFVVKVRYM